MRKLHISCKLICAVIALTVIFSIGALANNTGNYRYSPVTYENSEGEVINSIVAGEITAKITVSADESSDMLFAVLLYKDDTLVKADAMSKPADADGELFEATVSVSDASGCKITALLWDSAKTAKPICNASIFPNSSIEISAITINGKEPEMISENVYEHVVAFDELSIPDIKVETLDNGTKIDIDNVEAGDAFPGKAELKLTSSDGTNSRNLTINYVCDTANAAKLNPEKYTVNGVTYNSGSRQFQPLKITDITIDENKSGFTVNGEVGSHYFGNRGAYNNATSTGNPTYPNVFTYLNKKVDFLSGLYYITPLVTDGGVNYHGIDRTATIYRKMRVYTLALDSNEVTDSFASWTNYSEIDDSVDVYLVGIRDRFNEDKYKVMYFKDFTPTPEESAAEGLDISIPKHTKQYSIGGIFQPVW